MKKMFLASMFKGVAKLLAEFESNLEGKTVTFIPTASVVEKLVFYVEEGRAELEKLGLIVDVLEISTATADEIRTKLEKNEFIYVTGGNTFFLLQELKRTGADKIIAKEVNNGKLYIGESAGAMIASPNIEYASPMDSIKKAPNLTEYDALGLVDFSVIPHCDCIPLAKVVQNIIDVYSPTQNLISITNQEVVLVQGDEFKTKRNNK